jgi:hypothetical protein
VNAIVTVSLLQLFSSAADVLRRIGEDGRIIQEFIQLGAKAKVSASEAMDAEATLGEIPDEFLDPIQVCFKLTFLCTLVYVFIMSYFKY